MTARTAIQTVILGWIGFVFPLQAQTTVYTPIASTTPFSLAPSITKPQTNNFAFDISLSSLDALTTGRPVPSPLVIDSKIHVAAQAIPSPNGALTIHTSVEQSHADPTTYGCVIFEIHDTSGKVLHRENTHASDFPRWSIRWLSNEQIQLKSSDIGTYTWTRQPDNTWQKKP